MAIDIIAFEHFAIAHAPAQLHEGLSLLPLQHDAKRKQRLKKKTKPKIGASESASEAMKLKNLQQVDTYFLYVPVSFVGHEVFS